MAARCAAGRPPGRRLTAVLAVAGGLLVVALQLVAIEWQSVTSDEAFHLYAGFSALRYGTNTLNLEHPPLVKLLAAAPLAAEAEPYAPQVAMADAVAAGERLFDSAELAHRRMRRARLVLLATIGLPLVVACAALGRRWADPATGVLLALAVGLSFAVLPWLSLAVNDAAVALGFVLTLLAAERFLRRPGAVSAALLGAAAGLALSAKFSALLAAPTVAAALLLAPRHGQGWKAVGRRALAAGITALAAAAVVLGIYRVANPDYDRTAGRRSLSVYARGGAALIVEDRLRPWEPRLLALERISPGAAQWLAGVLTIATHGAHASLPAYVFGSVSSYGRWWYFPAVLLIKTPLVILAGFAAAAATALLRRRARPPPSADDLRRRRNALAVLTAGLFLAAAFASSYNHGVRYLLPVLPLLYLPAAWAAARHRVTAVAFAALLAAEAVALAPRWMSATNTWWLGEQNPTRFALSASDLEFHQNFRLLARDLDRLGVERVTVAFPALGPRRLQTYLPGSEVADPSRLPEPGWHAVTVAVEQLAPAILRTPAERLYRAEHFQRVAREWERYLRALRLWGEDHGYAGETFHLYRIPEGLESRPEEPR